MSGCSSTGFKRPVDPLRPTFSSIKAIVSDGRSRRLFLVDDIASVQEAISRCPFAGVSHSLRGDESSIEQDRRWVVGVELEWPSWNSERC
jgi:hypothetical protein